MMARAVRGNPAAAAPGAQGTMGGVAHASPGAAAPGRRSVTMGDEMYLWILVLAEVGVTFWLRATFSRYHGG